MRGLVEHGSRGAPRRNATLATCSQRASCPIRAMLAWPVRNPTIHGFGAHRRRDSEPFAPLIEKLEPVRESSISSSTAAICIQVPLESHRVF